jgi:hypothetical protein
VYNTVRVADTLYYAVNDKMDTNATDYRSGPLSGSVEELCYHDQRVVVGKEEGSRTVASYEAEINGDFIKHGGD